MVKRKRVSAAGNDVKGRKTKKAKLTEKLEEEKVINKEIPNELDEMKPLVEKVMILSTVCQRVFSF